MTDRLEENPCLCEGKRCFISADDPRHGTRNAYKNIGCRCPACKKANADFQRERGAVDPDLRERRSALQRARLRHEQGVLSDDEYATVRKFLLAGKPRNRAELVAEMSQPELLRYAANIVSRRNSSSAEKAAERLEEMAEQMEDNDD